MQGVEESGKPQKPGDSRAPGEPAERPGEEPEAGPDAEVDEETQPAERALTSWDDPYGEQDEDDEEEVKKRQSNRTRTWVLLALGLLLGVLTGKACQGG